MVFRATAIIEAFWAGLLIAMVVKYAPGQSDGCDRLRLAPWHRLDCIHAAGIVAAIRFRWPIQAVLLGAQFAPAIHDRRPSKPAKSSYGWTPADGLRRPLFFIIDCRQGYEPLPLNAGAFSSWSRVTLRTIRSLLAAWFAEAPELFVAAESVPVGPVAFVA